MKLTRFAGLAAALALLLGASGPAAAQPTVASADIQRLQDDVYDASRDVAPLRSRDAALASQLQAELDDARDETIYLKVKLRRKEPIARSEYVELRDKIENIRARARGDGAGAYTPPAATPAAPRRSAVAIPPASRSAGQSEVPLGTEFDVRLQNSLSSSTAKVEDRFQATTMADLRDERGKVLVPAGSLVRGVISSVNKAGHLDRKGRLTVAFDQVTIGERSYPMRGMVTQALQSEGIGGEKAKLGVGAGAGAVLGAVLGGAKGALVGVLVGSGGMIAATEGKDVELPAGTVLRTRLDSPLTLQR